MALGALVNLRIVIAVYEAAFAGKVIVDEGMASLGLHCVIRSTTMDTDATKPKLRPEGS